MKRSECGGIGIRDGLKIRCPVGHMGSSPITRIGMVVQLVRIPACRAGGCGFESRPPRIAPVTQLDRVSDF